MQDVAVKHVRTEAGLSQVDPMHLRRTVNSPGGCNAVAAGPCHLAYRPGEFLTATWNRKSVQTAGKLGKLFKYRRLCIQMIDKIACRLGAFLSQ